MPGLQRSPVTNRHSLLAAMRYVNCPEAVQTLCGLFMTVESGDMFVVGVHCAQDEGTTIWELGTAARGSQPEYEAAMFMKGKTIDDANGGACEISVLGRPRAISPRRIELGRVRCTLPGCCTPQHHPEEPSPGKCDAWSARSAKKHQRLRMVRPDWVCKCVHVNLDVHCVAFTDEEGIARLGKRITCPTRLQ